MTRYWPAPRHRSGPATDRHQNRVFCTGRIQDTQLKNECAESAGRTAEQRAALPAWPSLCESHEDFLVAASQLIPVAASTRAPTLDVGDSSRADLATAIRTCR